PPHRSAYAPSPAIRGSHVSMLKRGGMNGAIASTVQIGWTPWTAEQRAGRGADQPPQVAQAPEVRQGQSGSAPATKASHCLIHAKCGRTTNPEEAQFAKNYDYQIHFASRMEATAVGVVNAINLITHDLFRIGILSEMTPIEIFRDEVQKSQDRSMAVRIWWRDDDLIKNTPRFDALMQASERFSASILVAIIPGLASEQLDVQKTNPKLAFFCQHGWKHSNHELDRGGKSEFADNRDPNDVKGEIALGQAALARILGGRCLPIFVPPWNSIAEQHIPTLAERGFTGLSTYGRRLHGFAAPGVRLVNTHIDVLDWSAVGVARALPADVLFHRLAEFVRLQREKGAEDPEPIGILTHHRAMAEDAWATLDVLLSALMSTPGLTWASPPEVFAPRPEPALTP
ncbi:polysaccharide deacetylase family protein, partial [Azospirillum isscasi]